MPCNCLHLTSLRPTSLVSRGDLNSSGHAPLYSVRLSVSPVGPDVIADSRTSSNRKISEKHDKVFATGCMPIDPVEIAKAPRANAAFVVLARNKELDGVIQSLRSIERHFNRWYHYPYVFLNDGDFDEDFQATVKNYTSAPVEFGKIDSSMWGFPDWVDHEVAKEGIRKQGDAAIMYGGMESYHHMCRFYSGYVCLNALVWTILTSKQILLQAPSPAEIRMVLALGARDQVLL